MSPTVPPTPPARTLPDAAWEHYGLYCAVREALATLPIYFRTETHIAGVMATDLYTLNSVLGATIEEQVVRTLNLIRSTWDSSGKYALYSFVRQPQTFPDVRLRKATGDDTILGLEPRQSHLTIRQYCKPLERNKGLASIPSCGPKSHGGFCDVGASGRRIHAV